MNEHAKHALADFFGETYDSFRKLQERLDLIRRTSRMTWPR
jgi:hypothetical protein